MHSTLANMLMLAVAKTIRKLISMSLVLRFSAKCYVEEEKINKTLNLQMCSALMKVAINFINPFEISH